MAGVDEIEAAVGEPDRRGSGRARRPAYGETAELVETSLPRQRLPVRGLQRARDVSSSGRRRTAVPRLPTATAGRHVRDVRRIRADPLLPASARARTAATIVSPAPDTSRDGAESGHLRCHALPSPSSYSATAVLRSVSAASLNPSELMTSRRRARCSDARLACTARRLRTRSSLTFGVSRSGARVQRESRVAWDRQPLRCPCALPQHRAAARHDPVSTRSPFA